MTENKFYEILDSYQMFNAYIDSLNKLNIDLSETIVTNTVEKLFSHILIDEYGKDGYEWVSWWIYELPSIKEKHPDSVYAKEMDGTPIILETKEQLYSFLEKSKKI